MSPAFEAEQSDPQLRKQLMRIESPMAGNTHSARKPDLADIDRNRQHFGDWPAIASTRVGATLGWQVNSVRDHVI